MGEPEQELRLAPDERRPQGVHRGPQDVDVLVDDRTVDEALLRRDRSRIREAVVTVAGGSDDLLVARDLEERAAEDVDCKGETFIRLAQERAVGVAEQDRDRARQTAGGSGADDRTANLDPAKWHGRHGPFGEPVLGRGPEEDVGQRERAGPGVPVSADVDSRLYRAESWLTRAHECPAQLDGQRIPV